MVARFAPPGLRLRPRRQAPDLPDRARRRRGGAAHHRGERRRRDRLVARRHARSRSRRPGPDAKAKKDRKEKYGDFEIVGGDYTMNHLWLVEVPADLPADLKQLPKPEALTKGDQFSVGSFSWSPDGKRIAFSASRDPDLGSQRHRAALRARPGRPARPQTAGQRRPERQPEMVARRQADRLRHLRRQAVLLLREPPHRRGPGGRRHAAPAHRGVRRRPEPDRLGSRRHLLRRARRRPARTSSASTPPRAPITPHHRARITSTWATPPSPRTTARWPASAPRPTISPRSSCRPSTTFAPHVPHRHGAPVEGFPTRHARSGPVEVVATARPSKAF